MYVLQIFSLLTHFILMQNSFLLPLLLNFQIYFSTLKTEVWLPVKIHILFYIKNIQSNTLKSIKNKLNK